MAPFSEVAQCLKSAKRDDVHMGSCHCARPNLTDSEGNCLTSCDLSNLSSPWPSTLADPLTEESSHTCVARCQSPLKSPQLQVNFGASSSQNRRDHMEDVYCAVVPTDRDDVKESGSLDPYSFFGVFDGHSGKRAAEYVQKNLYMDLVLVLGARPDLKEALCEAFEQTESSFLRVAKDNEWMDGTTAAVALVDPIRHQCIIGNVGDSEIVHGYQNAAGEVHHQVLTEKHTMQNEAESERVSTVGGRVWHGRMAHPNFRPQFLSLAVSRSLGDIFFKDPEYTDGKESGLIAKPYIFVLDIQKSSKIAKGKEILILASDGLWDCISYDVAVELSFENLEQGMDPKAVSDMLVQRAAESGSKDNITVVLVTL